MSIEMKCPQCGGSKVATAAEQLFMVNTGEHYCHSIKPYDDDARAVCIDCGWVGMRVQLITHNVNRNNYDSTTYSN